MQKRIYLVVLLAILILAILGTGTMIILVENKVTGESVINIIGKLITGKSPFGEFNVSVFVLPALPTITIVTPENMTYSYAGVQDYYILGLNATANFEADTWWYRLVDSTRNAVINSSEIGRG